MFNVILAVIDRPFSDIDCSFFLVTVDLWSADGKQEMNLVLHPSNSSTNPVASSSNANRRPSKSGVKTATPTPAAPNAATSSHQTFSVPEPPVPPSQQQAPWSYHQDSRSNIQYPPNVLPSISTFSRRTPDFDETANTLSFRAWNAETPTVYSQSHTPQQQQPQLAPPETGLRQAFTRTLVGPLSSNATRLLDEHRKPGIFFLFQDLSIRTEGTFRLRLRLMNVGA